MIFVSVREIHECTLGFEGLWSEISHPPEHPQSPETGTNVPKLNKPMAEWQTQTTQNRSGNHVGSSPVGTSVKQLRNEDFRLFSFCHFYTLAFSGKMLTIAFEDTLLKSRCV